MSFQTITIPANGSYVESQPALVLTVKSCGLPITVAFNGGASEPCAAGSVFDKRASGGYNSFYFSNPNSVPVNVSYAVGNVPAAYSANDNSTSNAATYAFGNLGIATGAAASGSLPACNSTGYLQVTNAMALVIAGTNQGHRRQILTLSVSPASPVSLNVLDTNGFAFMTVAAGQQIALVTDAMFALSGAGGTAWVTVGQIYLNA